MVRTTRGPRTISSSQVGCGAEPNKAGRAAPIIESVEQVRRDVIRLLFPLPRQRGQGTGRSLRSQLRVYLRKRERAPSHEPPTNGRRQEVAEICRSSEDEDTVADTGNDLIELAIAGASRGHVWLWRDELQSRAALVHRCERSFQTECATERPLQEPGPRVAAFPPCCDSYG